jgi:hypothetical protein
VSPVKYEQGFYIPEGDILHTDRRENLKSYISIYFPFAEMFSFVFFPGVFQLFPAANTDGGT